VRCGLSRSGARLADRIKFGKVGENGVAGQLGDSEVLALRLVDDHRFDFLVDLDLDLDCGLAKTLAKQERWVFDRTPAVPQFADVMEECCADPGIEIAAQMGFDSASRDWSENDSHV
jgi:hypothetical protein